MLIIFRDVSHHQDCKEILQSLYITDEIKRIDGQYYMIEGIEEIWDCDPNNLDFTFKINKQLLPELQVGDEIITYGIKAGLYKGRFGKIAAVQDTTVDITFNDLIPVKEDDDARVADILNTYRFGKDAVLLRQSGQV